MLIRRFITERNIMIIGGLLLSWIMAASWGRASSPAEVVLLLPGTPYETEAYICRGSDPGPAAMVLGGVHGNEPAGWQAAEKLREIRPESGILIVIPRVNRLAVNAGERTLPNIGDVNRAYPGSREGTPAEQLAREIISLLERYQVSLFIDLHEAEDFHRRNPESLGQSVEFADNDRSALLTLDAMAAVNSIISDPERQFTFLGHPIAGSGANYAGHRYGIAAFTLETASTQPLADRIDQQCAVVRGLLKAVGMVKTP